MGADNRTGGEKTSGNGRGGTGPRAVVRVELTGCCCSVASWNRLSVNAIVSRTKIKC